MRPSSVAGPVVVTTPRPRPLATMVPLKAMSVRSASGASGATDAVDLSTGTDSPVSSDSSTRNELVATRRRSAGTRTPDSRSTTSPGTSSLEAISVVCPSRTTVAVGLISCIRARTDSSARRSWTKPMLALRASTAAMTVASRYSPSAMVSTPASMRM
jgi:hypothetical protein